MRAAIVPRYGPPGVVELVELPDPVPAPGEVLVRVRATTVSSGDARVRAFRVPRVFWLPARIALGVMRPRRQVLGTEFAGVVEGVGEGVSRFAPGDRVFGMVSFSARSGTHAELVAIAADAMIDRMPEGMTFGEAGCLCFGLHTARHFLVRAGKLQPGERVLVIGASGAVGCAVVQLARRLGAHVTAVCSTRHVDLMRELGANAVIDYTRGSYTELPDAHDGYDLVVDTVGASTPFACRRVMADGGRFIAVVADARLLGQAIWSSLTRSGRVITGTASERPEDAAYFREMVEAGAHRSVIDRRFPLDRIREAHELVDTGRKQGNVVITIGDGSPLPRLGGE
jgi:NADPH:quinone reductase-like Zn-dependent oxidoreductase